jgi:hypothetical protein
MSEGRALVGVEVPGVPEPCSLLRIAIRPKDPLKEGVSIPGVLGMEVGAVEYPPPDDCEEYELS